MVVILLAGPCRKFGLYTAVSFVKARRVAVAHRRDPDRAVWSVLDGVRAACGRIDHVVVTRAKGATRG